MENNSPTSNSAFQPDGGVYQQLALLVGDVLFVLDPASKRIHWQTDAAAQLLGYDTGELDLQVETLAERAQPADRPVLVNAIEDILQGERVAVDFRLKDKSGHYIWFQLAGGTYSTSASSNGAPLIGGVLRNTNELHEALSSLSEARHMETIGNMASGIAHEFNNHLTPISGYIELALDDLGAEHPLAEGLNTALERVRYCSDLVAQIQAYGRKSMLMPEYVNVTQLIPSTIRLALSFFPELSERITVKEDWVPDVPPIHVDRGQFQQALLHLFRNALEAMPEGGMLAVSINKVSESGKIMPASHPETEGVFLRISVTDTGIGIAPEDRMRIFDPFFTTHGRASARGMGLPMVQGMMAQHGGWIEINTELREGTTVNLYLPVAVPAEPSGTRTADADGSMPVAEAAPVGRMLIADDEPFIRRLIYKVFHPEGWHIDEAADNDEVTRWVRGGEHAYSLIILDLTMPGIATEDVLNHIRRRDPTAPVLFISGYTRDQRIERLLQSMPRADFINKPFSPKALLSVVDDLINR